MQEDPIAEIGDKWHRRGHDGGEQLLASLSIIRVETIIREAGTAVLRPLQLNYARYEILTLLNFTSHGEMPLGKIGERLMVHPTSITGVIDGLERLEFVKRVPHPTDRRGTLARITPAGRSIVEEAVVALNERAFGLGALSDADARTVVRILRKVRRSAGDLDTCSG